MSSNQTSHASCLKCEDSYYNGIKYVLESVLFVAFENTTTAIRICVFAHSKTTNTTVVLQTNTQRMSSLRCDHVSMSGLFHAWEQIDLIFRLCDSGGIVDEHPTQVESRLVRRHKYHAIKSANRMTRWLPADINKNRWMVLIRCILQRIFTLYTSKQVSIGAA